MTDFGGTLLSTLDALKRTDPDGTKAKVVERLVRSKPILRDMVMVKGNTPTGNRTTIRVGRHDASLRRINEGVVSGKSTTVQVNDSASIISSWTTVDARLLKFGQSMKDARDDEGMQAAEGVGDKMEDLFWNGSELDDTREFNGLMIRPVYNDLDSKQVLNAGGSGNDLSSIWLIVHSEGGIAGMYPDGTTPGIFHNDFALAPIMDGNNTVGGAKFSGYEDEWGCDFGLVVKDDRFAVRICNIENADVLGVSGTQELTDYATNIRYLMRRAVTRLAPGALDRGIARWYFPRTIHEGLLVQLDALTNGNAFTWEQVTGESGKLPAIHQIPMRISDMLGYTEPAVTT